MAVNSKLEEPLKHEYVGGALLDQKSMLNRHLVALQNMCLAAPINEFYSPSIEVSDSEAPIEVDVSERLFHAAGAVHGSVYFKMLDDAAFFAAKSLEGGVFVRSELPSLEARGYAV